MECQLSDKTFDVRHRCSLLPVERQPVVRRCTRKLKNLFSPKKINIFIRYFVDTLGWVFRAR
ncbi:unnamed protein product [Ixodes persulcatus]